MKITATKFDADALANSAKSYIEMLLNKKVTMAYVLNDWNICVEQSHFTGVFDFPATGYSRKAQIIADLENAIKQLNAYVEPSAETTEMQAIQLEHCFSCMARSKDTSNIIWNEEEAHTEALEMNVSTNEALTTDTTNDGDSQMTLSTVFSNAFAVWSHNERRDELATLARRWMNNEYALEDEFSSDIPQELKLPMYSYFTTYSEGIASTIENEEGRNIEHCIYFLRAVKGARASCIGLENIEALNADAVASLDNQIDMLERRLAASPAVSLNVIYAEIENAVIQVITGARDDEEVSDEQIDAIHNAVRNGNALQNAYNITSALTGLEIDVCRSLLLDALEA
ncbi:hypothetical protein UJ50_004560 [Salmonella enterica subsp. enterica]|nr:hypothetical protein [Salmonella enterica subsp. enterica]